MALEIESNPPVLTETETHRSQLESRPKSVSIGDHIRDQNFQFQLETKILGLNWLLQFNFIEERNIPKDVTKDLIHTNSIVANAMDQHFDLAED